MSRVYQNAENVLMAQRSVLDRFVYTRIECVFLVVFFIFDNPIAQTNRQFKVRAASAVVGDACSHLRKEYLQSSEGCL